MHAVVVAVTVHDPEAAEKSLRDEVVPRVSGAPGFVTGHWTRKGAAGLSMSIFETEDQANEVSNRVREMAPAAVTVVDVDVREVVAHA